MIAAICVALVVVTVAVYWPVLSFDFVNLDDPGYVSSNGPVQRGLSFGGWMYAWTSLEMVNWHPLIWLSLELDSTLWGTGPAGYHATNLILHILNVVLLFALLLSMTQRLLPSACVAAFFGLHPLHVESVAWITERKDVLSTFFLLLMLFAYLWYARRPGIGRYLAVAVLLALGLLSKQMLVTVPILLLLVDQWPLDRIAWSGTPSPDSRYPRQPLAKIVAEKIPLLGLSLGAGLMTVLAQRGAISRMEGLSFLTRLGNAVNAYLWYLQKTFVPTDLIVYYPHPGATLSSTSIAIAAVVLIAMSLWVSWRRRSRPELLFGWGWFVISLLPVIGLLQVGSQAYADRYTYVPHIGLFVLIVWEVFAWIRVKPFARVVGGVAILVALFTCGWLTRAQIAHWKNPATLWDHVLTVNPDNSQGNLIVAQAYLDEHQPAEALRHIQRGLDHSTAQPTASSYRAWGNALAGLKQYAAAEEKFRKALTIDPKNVFALAGLQSLLYQQNRRAEGDAIGSQMQRATIENCLRKPYDAASHVTLGDIELAHGNPRNAMISFQRAIELDPRFALAYARLGMAQLQQNEHQEAKANFERAIDRDPRLAGAYFMLGDILELESDLPRAIRNFRKAVELEPANLEFRSRLDRVMKR